MRKWEARIQIFMTLRRRSYSRCIMPRDWRIIHNCGMEQTWTSTTSINMDIRGANHSGAWVKVSDLKSYIYFSSCIRCPFFCRSEFWCFAALFSIILVFFPPYPCFRSRSRLICAWQRLAHRHSNIVLLRISSSRCSDAALFVFIFRNLFSSLSSINRGGLSLYPHGCASIYRWTDDGWMNEWIQLMLLTDTLMCGSLLFIFIIFTSEFEIWLRQIVFRLDNPTEYSPFEGLNEGHYITWLVNSNNNTRKHHG